MRRIALSLLLFTLTSCVTTPENKEHATLTPVSFADLGGWQKDAAAEALNTFLISCVALNAKAGDASLGLAGKAAAWQQACAAAQQTPRNDAAARDFFEREFTPYEVTGRDGEEGLFTAYYVPELRGALQCGGAFQTPLYARPTDIISVDLGAFKSDLKGQNIVGKVQGSKLVPYDERSVIAKGSLGSRAPVLACVDDPVGAFFLEVQGSGRVRLNDGSLLPIGYDGANGRAYVAIGRVLADRGALPRPVTMPAIRAWLAAHPDEAQEIMNTNPSYVFFRRLPKDEIVGAEGVALTPMRSLAIDTAFVSLGTPVWLDTTDAEGAALQRLMIAQDTGGAIKGPVRGDFFWGSGDTAAAEAGAMQSRGRYYLLLPRSVNVHDE